MLQVIIFFILKVVKNNQAVSSVV